VINRSGAFRPLNYGIRNEADRAVIDIDGFIGRDIWEEWMTGEKSPNSVEGLKEKLRSISSSKIIVNINSPGGDLNDGLVIKDMLQSKNVEVITNLQGFSASAATVISQAGTLRRMPQTSFMLIHRAMFGMVGYYNQNTFRRMIANAETIDEQLIRMYERSSNLSAEKIAQIMDEGEGYGRWMSADEALEHGLIDEVYDPADEGDENIDRLEGEEVENMKRNVEQLAAQAIHGTFPSNFKQNIQQKLKGKPGNMARIVDLLEHEKQSIQ